MRIYYYKLTADNGGAPCIKDGLLSLAICKPMIRSSAEPGDLVFGFAANSLAPDNRLIYIASVTAKERNGEYFRSQRYAHRGDCVYTWAAGQFNWRQGALYHGPDHLIHDLGIPPEYDRAIVLLSDSFRYFGKFGTSDYKRDFPLVREAVENLGQGHRVKHVDQLRGELLDLRDQVWAEYQGMVHGKPSGSRRRNVCQRSRSCGVV